MEKVQFRPLPHYVTIAKSDIEGLGLFATEYIPEGTNLGISHIKFEHKEIPHNLIRNGLGSFINHSKCGNAKIINEGLFFTVETSKNILAGEEITVDYYNSPCGEDYVDTFISKEVC